MPKERHLKCGSRVLPYNSNFKHPYHLLSNFALAPIKVSANALSEKVLDAFPLLREWLRDEKTFQSAEHLWQSLKAIDYTSFCAFCDDGQYARLTEQAFGVFYKSKQVAQRKMKFWSRKQNEGIIAKLVANPQHRKKVGIALDYTKENLDADLERAVWADVLRLKFTQHPELKQVLLDTRDDYLLEHSRSAKSRYEKHCITEHWAGLVDESGDLYGDNAMGRYLMSLRTVLAETA